MTHRSILLSTVLVLALGLTVGCSKKQASETDSEAATAAEPAADPTAAPPTEPAPNDDAPPPEVDSKLLGVYTIDNYQRGEAPCSDLKDLEPKPVYVVLYGFRPSSNPDEVRLGGTFCGSANLCRAIAARAPEPAVGYSFLSGDDAAGWQGWAVTGTGPEDEQCSADVQAHSLASKKKGAIRIETKTVHTVFPPVMEGEVAQCSNRDAIAAVEDDLACKSLLVLEGTFEAAL